MSTTTSNVPRKDAGGPQEERSLRRRAASVMTVLALTVAVLIGSSALAAPAQAASAGCSNGRCTVWLSNAETRALGAGRVPAVSGLGRLGPAFIALVAVHKAIARVYGRQGKCSGFRLSIYPWESQGYFGYRC